MSSTCCRSVSSRCLGSSLSPISSQLIHVVIDFAAIVISWSLFKSLFSTSAWSKGWRRVAFNRACFWAFKRLNRRQARAAFGETFDTYNGFMKSVKMEPLVEELGDGARLLWVGPKRTERVVLYFHGLLPFAYYLFRSFIMVFQQEVPSSLEVWTLYPNCGFICKITSNREGNL